MSNSDSDLDFESADEGEENTLLKSKDFVHLEIVKKSVDVGTTDAINIGCYINENIVEISDIIEDNENMIANKIDENKFPENKSAENKGLTDKSITSDDSQTNNFLAASIENKDIENNVDIQEQDNFIKLNNINNKSVISTIFAENNYNKNENTDYNKHGEKEEIVAVENEIIESSSDFNVNVTDKTMDTVTTNQCSLNETRVCEPEQSVAFMLDKLVDKQQDSWGNSWTSGWGSGWGSSVIAAAKSGVSTLGRELAVGITTVSNKMESVLDVPAPEEIALVNVTLQKEAKNEINDKTPSEESDGWANWDAWPSAGSTVTVTTGRAVVSSGLQALEQLGRRTMMALEQHDPGLNRTRAMLKRDASLTGQRQNLSAVLREAAEKAQCDNNSGDEKKSYSTIFSEMHGSMHLEALELLAAQCETRLTARLGFMRGKQWRDLRSQLDEMRQLLESSNEEDEDDEDDAINEDLIAQFEMIDLTPLTSCDSILNVLRSVEEKSKTEPAAQCLAQLTAASVEQLHRIGQTALQRGQQVKNWKAFCAQLVFMVRLLRQVASNIAQRTSIDSPHDNDARHLTAVLLEAAHSRGCIQDTALRLLPILQFASLPEQDK